MVSPPDLILKRLAGLAARRPGFALGLWGEAGIGKTHAAQGLMRQTPIRGLHLHATTSWADLIRSLPQPRRFPIWAERALERGEYADARAMIDALSALLSGLAPFILHLEDLHEASPERLEIVRDLARTVPKIKGAALIVTSRTQPPEPFEVVRLEPLSRQASDALLETEAGSKLPPEALEWVHARAMGNPLFTLEHFRYLARQGYLWNDTRRWGWRRPPEGFVPITIEALIERLLNDAGDTAAIRAALDAKALLPVGSPDALWAAIAGLSLEALTDAQLELGRRGVLAGHEFVHPLVREIAASHLPASRRQVLGRRALAVLGDDPQTAAVFVEDARLESDRTRALLERAAQAAGDRGDEVRAARFLARATEYASGAKRGELALQAALLLRYTDLTQATRLAETAIAMSSANVNAVYLLAELYSEQGHGDQADLEAV